MNKIVRDHYPVSRLPEDLRNGLDPNDTVRVVIEETPGLKPDARSLRELLEQARRSPPLDSGPERIRNLRDEWDD